MSSFDLSALTIAMANAFPQNLPDDPTTIASELIDAAATTTTTDNAKDKPEAGKVDWGLGCSRSENTTAPPAFVVSVFACGGTSSNNATTATTSNESPSPSTPQKADDNAQSTSPSLPPFTLNMAMKPSDPTVLNAIRALRKDRNGTLKLKQIAPGLKFRHPYWDEIEGSRLKKLMKKADETITSPEKDDGDRKKGKKKKNMLDDQDDKVQDFLGHTTFDVNKGVLMMLAGEIAQLCADVDGRVDRLPKWLSDGHTKQTGKDDLTFILQGIMVSARRVKRWGVYWLDHVGKMTIYT